MTKFGRDITSDTESAFVAWSSLLVVNDRLRPTTCRAAHISGDLRPAYTLLEFLSLQFIALQEAQTQTQIADEGGRFFYG